MKGYSHPIVADTGRKPRMTCELRPIPVIGIIYLDCQGANLHSRWSRGKPLREPWVRPFGVALEPCGSLRLACRFPEAG